MKRLLTDDEVKKLKDAGYTDEQIEGVIRQEELEYEYQKNGEQYAAQDQGQVSDSQFDSQQHDTIARLQLECTKVLRDIERLLKCDDSVFINGNYVFVPTKDDRKKVFNDYGVKVLMRFMRMYVNPMTILAFYSSPDEIKGKVYQFGIELTDLIYMKHVEFGMDTDSKCKEFPMLINSVKDIVHNCYTRAYQGIGNETLGKIAGFDNPQPEGPQYGVPMMPQQGGGPSLNPMTWFRR